VNFLKNKLKNWFSKVSHHSIGIGMSPETGSDMSCDVIEVEIHFQRLI
jgi:hypothetical protein